MAEGEIIRRYYGIAVSNAELWDNKCHEFGWKDGRMRRMRPGYQWTINQGTNFVYVFRAKEDRDNSLKEAKEAYGAAVRGLHHAADCEVWAWERQRINQRYGTRR